MNAPLRDPVLLNDWHPVAISSNVVLGKLEATTLLDTPVVIWRDAEGVIHAWEDRCPHRGIKLSMGGIETKGVVCPYHGWVFGSDAQCCHVPALPDADAQKINAKVKTFAVKEQYGLVWVCLGTPVLDVLPFPEFADKRLRKVWCGPYEVASSAPRIIENFLDMPHFMYVHTDILGDKRKPEIPSYDVEPFDDPTYGQGVRAFNCKAWQPRTNALAHDGSMVEYTYRVVRPLTAILTKQPEVMSDFHEAISLHLQPVSETVTRAWIILAMTNFQSTDEELRGFQDTIFLQDKPIVENQIPLRLPLVPGAEVSISADRMSTAYRRYLKTQGLRYGVVTE